MKSYRRSLLGAALAVASTATVGCDSFLEVENPTVIESSTVDPLTDAETFSLSAQTDFFEAYDDIVVYGAFYSGEAWVDDTFPTRNDIAKRNIDPRNSTVAFSIFAPLARSVTTNLTVLDLLKGSKSEVSISTARAALNLGFSLQLMAETFCSGVINVGPELTPTQTSEEAVRFFQMAIDLATQVGGADSERIINAAQVGLARAFLQIGAGPPAQQNNDALQKAIAAARKVPVAFNYEVVKVDDPSFRGRLGNTVFGFTRDRPNLVVPPYFRVLDDPRTDSSPLRDAAGNILTGQGGNLEFFRQVKYPGYGTNLRLASGLEAAYVLAEASLLLGDEAPARALIAARSIPGTRDGDDVDFVENPTLLTELLDQKVRDFYLEGKHMGDFRRHPTLTPYVPPAGSLFYAPSVGGTIGAETCFAIPEQERDANPNL